MPFSPTLRHRTPRALCRSVEKNTDSLVKGMILFDQGEGGRGGGNRSWSKVLPPSVRGLLVFCCCLRERLRRIFSDDFAGSKILVGNSPLDPLHVPTLLAISMAVAIRWYDTAHIARWRRFVAFKKNYYTSPSDEHLLCYYQSDMLHRLFRTSHREKELQLTCWPLITIGV